MQEREEAAAKIQAVQRGKKARKEQLEREQAAIKIQAAQRGKAARRDPREQEQRAQMTKIRSVWKQMTIGRRHEWVGASEILKGFKLLGAHTMTMQGAIELAKCMSKNNDGRVTKDEFSRTA